MVGNLFLSKCCEFYDDDVTVTSVMNITYGDVTVESIPQGAALLFILSGLNNLPPTQFTRKCIQYIVIIILLDRQYMFDVKSLLRVEKVLLRRNDLAAVLF